jgi:hypothetical protein
MEHLAKIIGSKSTVGKNTSELEGLLSRARHDLHDWDDINQQTSAKMGGNTERERFVIFHPRLAAMVLTACVIDGHAALTKGSVRDQHVAVHAPPYPNKHQPVFFRRLHHLYAAGSIYGHNSS